MDFSLEREGSSLGSLFEQIMNDMKNTSPLWEDFITKANKLHMCLRAAIQAIGAYLDAFQKIADAATNSRGASKEIGTALTRVCLRHRAVETRLKAFTSTIMDCLVQPLQDAIEDWKRRVVAIDKEHAKDYKRCRTELKKRSNDTLRLQKKARKGQLETKQSLMDSHMQDITLRRAELQEVEKVSLRSAIIEERMRYCTFVQMLQPVVKEECEVISELGHLQEAMESIAFVTKEPNVLPQLFEVLINDAKPTMLLYPESPSSGWAMQGGGCTNSLGSRKSSVCSINSINSSGSSTSPGHQHYSCSLSQFVEPAISLKPGESLESGYCSTPVITAKVSVSTNPSHNVSTWPPHSQDEIDTPPIVADRPHTISTAYEKGHQRPQLTVYTFQNPETCNEGVLGPNGNNLVDCANNASDNASHQNIPTTQKPSANTFSRPPIPIRCSSLERPLSSAANRSNSGNLLQRQCPSPIPAHITKELSSHHAQQQLQQQKQIQNQQQQHPPAYVNMSEISSMVALKLSSSQQKRQERKFPPPLHNQSSTDSIISQQSNDANVWDIDASAHRDQPLVQCHANSARSHSISSSVSSTTTSQHSFDSTVAVSLLGQTQSPSSGSSTPHNQYSLLLTNSPTSTAAGTPSSASISSDMTGSGFVFNVNSPTSPHSANTSTISNALKITETEINQVQSITQHSNEITPNTDTTNTESTCETESPTIVEKDYRLGASVLQKASMFEKQAAAIAVAPLLTSGTSALPPRSNTTGFDGGIQQRRSASENVTSQIQYHVQSIEQINSDTTFEDSIQALNNLIGELDLFQCEIQQTTVPTKNNRKTDENDSRRNSDLFVTLNINRNIKGDCIGDNTLHQLLHQTDCTSSNQTCSSGCGTDVSDTKSDEVTVVDNTSNCQKMDHHLNKRHSSRNDVGDSELSHYYINDTNLHFDGMVSVGYENPTFVHFVANATSPITSSASVVSSSSQLSHCSVGNSCSLLTADHIKSCSDNENAVIVIYDHQLPITPDIDYVKQNSEIVILRTKDPQSQSTMQLHEMRELQQLPKSFQNPTVSTDCIRQQTATVAPAKQRLSSFRSSNSGIQNTGMEDVISHLKHNMPAQHHHQQQLKQGAQKKQDEATDFHKCQPKQNAKIPNINDTENIFAYNLRVNNNQCQNMLQVQQQEKSQQLLQNQSQISQQQVEPHFNNTKCKQYSANALQTNFKTTNNCISVASTPIVNSPVALCSSISSTETVTNINSSTIFCASDHQYTNSFGSISIPTLSFPSSTVVEASTNASVPAPSDVCSSRKLLLNACTSNENSNTITMVSKLLSSKPSITPKPASLLGCTRIARCSSINTKPLPPVRRSSSATPVPNTAATSFRTSSPSIYAEPKIVNMSSFRTSSGHQQIQHSQPKTNPILIAQLNARLNSNQHQNVTEKLYSNVGEQTPNHHHYLEHFNEKHSVHNSNQKHQHLSPPTARQRKPPQYDDHVTNSNVEKSDSIHVNSKAENRNAKLPKQGISGRAFVVRNIINSKVSPDPRLCHESLMDQIKRGATLRRNQKVNDRSAPKIYQ